MTLITFGCGGSTNKTIWNLINNVENEIWVKNKSSIIYCIYTYLVVLVFPVSFNLRNDPGELISILFIRVYFFVLIDWRA